MVSRSHSRTPSQAITRKRAQVLRPALENLEQRLLMTTVTGVRFNDGLLERSTIAKISVDFDVNVSSTLSIDDLVLTRSDTGANVDLTGATFSLAGNTGTWNLAALPTSRIPDGFYRAKLKASGIADGGGVALDGNRDGSAGDDFSCGAFKLSGDATGDGTVDNSDLQLVRDNFLKALAQQDRNADLNSDGAVNANDLLIVRRAWQAIAKPPVPLERVQTISDLAAALYFRPEKAAEYVVNNVRFQPYAGAKKGAAATLQTKTGNAWDTSALLVGLLNEAGVFARFADAQVESPAASVRNWLGVKNNSAAGTVLANAGLNVVNMLDGSGNTTAFRWDHGWVQAYLPNTAGVYAWKDFDPSWKSRDLRAGVPNLITLVPFNESAYLAQTRKELTSEFYENQVAQYLASNSLGASLADVPYDGPIIRQKVAAITGTLPVTVISTPATYNQTPAVKTHRVNLRLTNNSGSVTYFSQFLSVPDVSLNRITVGYADVGGGQLRPQLRLDGQVFAQGASTIASGAGVVLSIEHYNADGNNSLDLSNSYSRTAGEYIAIGLNAGQISQGTLDRLQQLVTAASIAKINGSIPAQDDLIGGFLSRAVMGYWYERERGAKLVSGLTEGVYLSRFVESGITTSASTVTYQSSLVNPYLPDSFNLDVANSSGTTYSLDAGSTTATARNKILSYNGSAEEHAIWEEVAQTPSISTIKSLQLAGERSIPVFTINQSNYSTYYPQLTVSASVKSDVQQRILVNNETITIPRDNTNLNSWQGVGFIATSAAGNSQAFIIFGGLASGSTGGKAKGKPAHIPDRFLRQTFIQGGSGTGTTQTPTNVPTSNNPDQPYVGDPINIANGNVTHDETDFVLPAVGLALQFSRHYDSQGTTNIGMGLGWSHSYSDFLTVNPDSSVTWTDSNGMRFTFVPAGGGSYTVPNTLHGTFTLAGGLYTFRNKDGLKHTFNSSGRLTEIRDRNDNVISLTYDGSGRLTNVIDADVSTRRLTFTYAANLISTVNDSTGRIWTYSYSSTRLASVTTPSDAQTPAYTTQYSYYTDTALGGLLQQVTQADGGMTKYAYYPDRRGMSVTDPEGNVHSVLYNLYRDRSGFVDERSNLTLYSYNASGNLVQKIYPDRAIESWVWTNSLMLSHTDPLSHTESWSYDSRGNILSMTNLAADVSTYTYDGSFSQLTSASLPGARNTTFVLDAHGNMLELHDAESGVTLMTYDPRGLMLTVTDPRGTVTPAVGDYTTAFTYNNAGKLVTRASDLPSLQTYTYDARGNRLSVTDANNHTTAYSYDLLNRRLSSTNALNGVASQTFTPLAGPGASVDQLGRTTSYVYDGNLRLTRSTDGALGVTNFTYDPTGNLLSSRNPLGQVTQYVYDSRNRRIQTLYPDGAVERLQYDGAGRIVASIDALGNTTRYSYDAMGRLLSTTDPLNHVSSMTYDGVGNVLTSTDPLNHVTTYVYDKLNRRTSTTNALLQASTATYDKVGNVLTSTDFASRTLIYTYDVLSRRRTQTDNLNHTTTFNYDAAGNLLTSADALNHTTTNVYDALNRQTSTTDALSHATLFSYDAVGNLVSLTDPDGNTTASTYDGMNRVLSETNQLGLSRSYSYDADGNLLATTDRNGHVRKYAYDVRDRLLTEQWLDSTGASIRTITSAYDLAGHRTSLTDPSVGYTYTYDTDGRVTSVTAAGLTVGGTQTTTTYYGTLTTSSSYFLDGSNQKHYLDQYVISVTAGDVLTINMTSSQLDSYLYLLTSANVIITTDNDSGGAPNARITYTATSTGQLKIWATSNVANSTGAYTLTINSATSVAQNAVITYVYDAADNVTSVTDNTGGSNTYLYDALNRETRVSQSGTNLQSLRADFGWNGADQPTSLTRYSDLAGTQLVASSAWGYDLAGRLTSLAHSRNATNLGAYSWTYDAADRITQTISPDGTSNFSYDTTNQLTSATHSYQTNEGYTYDNNGNRTNAGYSTGSDNRLTSDGTYTYQYDNEGNRTRRTTIATGQYDEYTWDYRNRLTRIQTKTSAGVVTKDVQYTYDALDRRVIKSVDADGAGAGAAVVERSIYDREDILIQTDGNGAVTHHYLHGPGVDQVLADQQPASVVLWALADHQGTVHDLINNAGTVQNHIKYDSFGKITAESNPVVKFAYAYTGRERDTESGMHYYRARYYDPGLGRFISQDPSTFTSGDTNFYRYVLNDPIYLMDPSGMHWSNIFRLPDYFAVNLNIAIPNPWTATVVGWSGTASVDRYGNWYWSPLGIGAGKSATIVSGSLTANWITQFNKPTESQLQNFLSGHGVNVTGGIWGGLSGSWSPSTGDKAFGIGVVSPQIGGSYNYSFYGGNTGITW
jgi:RHS repeat-associated protein